LKNMLISIAWRNIWRNKLRSLVVILAVTLGLFGTLFIIALSNGMVEQKISETVHNEISHIQIHDPQFIQDNSLKYPVANAENIVREAASIQGVQAVCSRIKTTAMASTANTGTGIIVNGIDPASEKQVTNLYQFVTDGNYFEKESRTPQILISQKLANKLKAKSGSKIVMTIQNTEGDLVYGLFRVTGIYKTSNGMFDEPNVFVQKNDLCSLTGFDPKGATEIAVLMQNTEMTGHAVEQLKAIAPGMAVMSWDILEPTLKMMSTVMKQYSYFLLGIILAAMAFGIVNTMLMSILERTRELGMLMSVGMNRRKIFIMIMMETIFLAVVGTIAGVAASAVTISLTSKHGINFAAWSEGFESLGYSALVYPMIYNSIYYGLGIMVIITAILASIYPARKALRMNPAEAVRNEA
jgi:putative ABC transport system permease protein